MRKTENQQNQFGEMPIGSIRFNPKDRDDIPVVLRGLQHIYTDGRCRAQVFSLLQSHVCAEVDPGTGRPGMDLWKILVLGVLKAGLNCDFDRLVNLANSHMDVRRMLGLGTWHDDTRFELQTVIGNVSRLTPQLLSRIGEVVVRSGHEVAGKKPGAPLCGRADSFVVETDVHYPTDVGLLWDSERCLIREVSRAARRCGLPGWRQHRHWKRSVKKLYNSVCKSKQQRNNPQKVADYLECCEMLIGRAESTLEQLLSHPSARVHEIAAIDHFLWHARHQVDLVRRCLLQGETIAAGEKVHSIFEPHTRWVSKGKAGVPVELGVPVTVVEDQYQFIVHHEVMWDGHDVDVAVPVVEQVRSRFPEFIACSFDRNYHSADNRVRLDEMLDLNVLPKKGKLSEAELGREAEESFAAARKQHPAVESAINHLEHCGLDRVRTHGRRGFERTVALSVLTANTKRLGRLLHKRDRKLAKRTRHRLRAA